MTIGIYIEIGMAVQPDSTQGPQWWLPCTYLCVEANPVAAFQQGQDLEMNTEPFRPAFVQGKTKKRGGNCSPRGCQFEPDR